MKKKLLILLCGILLCFFIPIALFGILGIVLMASESDIFGVIVFVVITLIGALPSWFSFRKIRSLRQKKSSSDNVRPVTDDSLHSDADIYHLVSGDSDEVSDPDEVILPDASEPIVEEPDLCELVNEEPVIDEPVVEEPDACELVDEEPAVEEPDVEEPDVEEPVSRESVPDSVSEKTEEPPVIDSVPVEEVKEPSFPDIYLVLDVETPNPHNDRISQIGLLLVENGVVIENHSTLINPEVFFSPINKKITSIDASMVANSPKFNEYWSSVRSLFEKYVVIAHNAAFDLSVLCKTLDHYALDIPTLNYVCTYVEAQNRFLQLKGYSLSSLTDYFGIDLSNAHNAECDATACYQIFEKMKELKYQFTPGVYTITYDREDIRSKASQENVPEVDVIDLPYFDDFDYVFEDKRFVLTGLFIHMPTKSVSEFITNHGGIIAKTVSGKTDYLVVGSRPEVAWKYGNYGTKIEKALALLDGDSPNIHIVRESLITDYINSCL